MGETRRGFNILKVMFRILNIEILTTADHVFNVLNNLIRILNRKKDPHF